jgi:HSP20 family protein
MTFEEIAMKLDLSKWNPFKFARRHSDERGGGNARAYAHEQQPQQQNQQGQPSTALQQMGGGVPQSWSDRGGLPDPVRMMASMMRDPFGSLTQLERWFGDFSPVAFEPRIDVADRGDAIVVTAELPGVDRNDVQVMLEDEYVVLSGEKKLEKTEEEEGVYRVERAFGSFQRVIPLPEGVDTDRAEAKFENGNLTIRIPKVAGSPQQGRKLDIGQASASAPGTGTGKGGTSGTPQQG